jgi:hypothetical protein
LFKYEEAPASFRDDATAEETTSFDVTHVLLTIANDYADQDVVIGYAGPAHAVYRGRPLALKRAITNLIENATKYAKGPEIELLSEEKSLVVAIRDRGPVYLQMPSMTYFVLTIESINRAIVPRAVLDSAARNHVAGARQHQQ